MKIIRVQCMAGIFSFFVVFGGPWLGAGIFSVLLDSIKSPNKVVMSIHLPPAMNVVSVSLLISQNNDVRHLTFVKIMSEKFHYVISCTFPDTQTFCFVNSLFICFIYILLHLLSFSYFPAGILYIFYI